MSFGFTKNGGMNAEALIFFRSDLADEALVLRKRAGHLLSKGRYLAAQLLAMLEEEVWLDNARAANAAARALAEVCGSRLVHPVQANELFVRMTPDEAAALRGQGFDFYDWASGEIRLVTSWDQDMGAVARLAAAIRAFEHASRRSTRRSHPCLICTLIGGRPVSSRQAGTVPPNVGCLSFVIAARRCCW